ncbi:hypothetical protein SAMN03097699_0352 [Flavobacteriaceae bacterium MAR_2010_188]|nr:hypothetical protein SAMN03097699_0352 [Flavobacteriaceae bacterium MAR_2010_188]
MKNIKIVLSFLAFLMAGTLSFAQERTGENEKVDDKKVVKEAKKEQQEYEKENGKVNPKNRQDSNPEPKVKPNDELAKDKGESDDVDDQMDSDDEGMGNMKDKPNDVGKGQQKDKPYKMDKENEMAKENSNNGNAYGKDKGNMSGREFGQARAADARNKIDSYEQNYDDRQLFIKKSQDRIQKAKNRLAEDTSSGKYSAEEITERQRKIEFAEQRMDELKQSIIDGRTRLKTQKEQLARIYQDGNNGVGDSDDSEYNDD